VRAFYIDELPMSNAAYSEALAGCPPSVLDPAVRRNSAGRQARRGGAIFVQLCSEAVSGTVCRVAAAAHSNKDWATISHSTVVHHAPAEGDRSLRSPWEWLIVPERVYGANVTEMHSGTSAGHFPKSQARS